MRMYLHFGQTTIDTNARISLNTRLIDSNAKLQNGTVLLCGVLLGFIVMKYRDQKQFGGEWVYLAHRL